MAKKAKATVKVSKGFSVNEIIANIGKKNLESLKERIEQRVEVMVTSLANREAETEHYAGRVDRMIAGLQAAGTNPAKLNRWFEKKF